MSKRKSTEKTAARDVLTRDGGKESKESEGARIRLPRLSTRNKIIVLIGLALAVVGTEYSKDEGKKESKTVSSAPAKPVSTPRESPEKKESFIVDGVEIKTSSVPEADFRQAYERAQSITGGLYWEPKSLKVEYGDVFDSNIKGETGGRASWTSDKLDEIISNPDMLTHELVHFLLGPGAKNWPLALQELFASTADAMEENRPEVPYQEMNLPWVQMPTDESLHNPSPLITFRYLALSQAGDKFKDKLPEVARDAMGRTDINFKNLAEFLAKYGINHHILSPGETGEQVAFVRFKGENGPNEYQDGYVYVRYKRVKGDSTEYPYAGPHQAVFIAEDGREFPHNVRPMQGVIFLPPPNRTNKFVRAMVNHPDGQFHAQLDN
ncbi:hypothetical protein HOG17_02900 [Candidatus Peregrinibacteria bacterium]|jgi:hypothetical protein|nr:hypothetical protein [Candidatus Peregrinibacteria bacterium]MBT4148537.1 hypothetical protein [Candidatus Peregrinibacteria bacterium]MBT4456151.1 hypothetical protein [Candidatus Peregrinibacteria bacterium]